MKLKGHILAVCLLILCGCQWRTPLPTVTHSLPEVSHSPRPQASMATPAAIPGPLTATNLESVVWIGDSFATGGNVIPPLTSSLKSIYGDGGPGWIDLYYLSSIDPNVTVAASKGWVQQRNTSGATGINLSDIRTSDVTTPAHLTITVKAQSVTLFY